MTPREIVLEQIRRHETDPIPYSLAFEPGVLERLDAHYGSEHWRKRLSRYLVVCGRLIGDGREPIDEHHFRDLFGTVWRTDGAEPVVVKPALETPSFSGYEFPTADQVCRSEVLEEIAASSKENRDVFRVANIGICLWQAWYVRGFQETLMDCLAEEEFYGELLDRFTELTIGLIRCCDGLDVDAVMMGDDWGDQRGVLIGPDRWRRFFKPRYARIFKAIHDQGKIAILHCCGSVADIMDDIVEIELDVLESVQPEAAGMSPYALKKRWGDKLTFWGCLGTQEMIPFRSPGEIRAEIRRLRTAMGKGGGYILAPAKPLRPETPTENAVAVVEEFIGRLD